MLFNSIEFIIFLPIAVIGFYLVPKNFKKIWLLICSYYFYMQWNPIYVVLLFATTITTYVSALCVEKSGERLRKIYLIVCLLINFGLLVFFKYGAFIIDNISMIIPSPCINISVADDFFAKLVLPVGISFYTFQLVGYIIDVYRGEVTATHNFVSFALFASFFPQLVAGPIERASKLQTQIDNLNNRKKIDIFRDIYVGFYQMAWGFFLKLVIADRTALLTDEVLRNYTNYGLIQILIAIMFFTIRIYCDFNGYTYIARGAAKCMGFELSINFRQPYFAISIHDFWKRWHITLTKWFKDYLYIPLGGNRKGKIRKYINVMIVFLCSGLWHGASWHFVIWGGVSRSNLCD